MDAVPGAIGCCAAVAAVWWSWFYPARWVGESWYGTVASRVFLYLIPSFAFLCLLVAVQSMLGALGVPMPGELFDPLAVVLFVVLLVGILGTLGVPIPAPWAPRWMRRRRREDRAAR
ncbi:hypothetical protein [Brevibacterium jeotgali]|uniref:Uncharacterized protein n=1 Tax=Brevibacterium jeotgali TaxID=1262550 RepID=A0A2H1L2R5_9MICO|nr:hypothetical protein [Brevibacterium jeotgali]TWC02409.1 hypothetical protein FB108_1085 [Brevibacterium jeotgali]SMY11201.1 hypothetical protein BJEO58_00784 [Brevibacterium jeotgali]